MGRGPSSMYQLELDRQQASRAIPQRERDDEAGFAGQAEWGASCAWQDASQDESPDADGEHAPSEEDEAKAQAFGDLLDAILAGTAPAAVLDRAAKCAMDCAKISGRPVANFMTDAARSVAVSIIYG